ncbi:MAG TPA: hypothetical protein VM223_08705 [Planctomycetota bacterium]|nr:hypothetical protein [Planctomycetota bacterium]
MNTDISQASSATPSATQAVPLKNANVLEALAESRVGSSDDLISLAEAARRLPKIDGKKVSVCTLWPWCRKGLRGEHLEYVRLGRKICVSPKALQCFFARLTEADRRVPPDTRSLPPSLKRSPITSLQRQRALAEADAVLRRAGI